MFQGAVGMTYEQGGSGRAGRAVQTAVGDTLTLTYRIQNHVESGLATIESAGMHADRMLKEFAAYHRRNAEDPWGEFTGYVVPADNDAARIHWLTQLLESNGISFGMAKENVKLRGLDYSTLTNTNVQIHPGDLLIDAKQPMSSLLQVLMDPNPELSDSLTYDITTWALPYAYGLEAYAITSTMPETRAWQWSESEVSLEGEGPAYAYLLHYQTDSGTPILANLLKQGHVVRVAKRPMVIDGVT